MIAIQAPPPVVTYTTRSTPCTCPTNATECLCTHEARERARERQERAQAPRAPEVQTFTITAGPVAVAVPHRKAKPGGCSAPPRQPASPFTASSSLRLGDVRPRGAKNVKLRERVGWV